MVAWPYPLQETFKGATILLMLLACLRLWRRWSGNPMRPSFGSISYVVCLALVTGMEFAAAVLRLWPYAFSWPHNPMLLGKIYDATSPLAVLAICAGVVGLVGRGRARWAVVCLAILLFFQWGMFRSGEPALVIVN
jgi:hypothetical protein